MDTKFLKYLKVISTTKDTAEANLPTGIKILTLAEIDIWLAVAACMAQNAKLALKPNYYKDLDPA